MTEALYSEDAYLKSCQAQILRVEADHVVVDRTVFYPLGGGQPGDTGWLSTGHGIRLEVTDTRRVDGGEIGHFLADPSALSPGDQVHLELDWDRRYAHMRMHTCLHLLGSLLQFPVTGGNISAAKSRLDFDMAEPVNKEELTRQLNALLQEDHQVGTRWITDQELDAQPELIRTMSVKPPRGAGRVRLLEIPGVDLQPCGGTHIRHTAEIGPVRVSKVEKKGRQNRRVNVVFEGDAR